MNSYNPFHDVVRNMMTTFGGQSTLIVPAEGYYDPDTSEYVSTTDELPVRTLVFDFTLQSNGSQASPNTMKLVGDKQVFVQPLGKSGLATSDYRIRPEKDSIRIDSVVYKIVTCKELNPSTSDCILFELLIRR